jgi:hypothetical protein
MKHLVSTTAIALISIGTAANAQSVLERVLGQIDNATNLAPVNGTFANIAENIGGGQTVSIYQDANGNQITGAEYDALLAQVDQSDYTAIPTDSYVNPTTGDVITSSAFSNLSATEQGAYVLAATETTTSTTSVTTSTTTTVTGTTQNFNQNVNTTYTTNTPNAAIASQSTTTTTTTTGTPNTITTTYTNTNTNVNVNRTTSYYMDAQGNVISAAQYSALASVAPETLYTYQGDVIVDGLAGIDGSINNLVDGLTDTTQQALASATVSATQWDMPTLNFGDMATTALGAVNTGDITLGVNSAVDEATTSTTQAVSSVMEQIGGAADTGAIVLNIASNMTGVNGSINNVMSEVNGSIGNLSTTALGAVNTGTITSGVNAAVQGIVGTSGQ